MARDYKKELEKWNSPENRKKRQAEYMEKHGPPEPRRKRLTPPDLTAQRRADKIKDMHDRFGGGEKGKPHSSREGRVASGKRTLKRFRKRAEDVMSGKPKVGRAAYQSGGRTRLLEELGRVEAEPSNRNRRAEINRVHGELNRGYARGGKAGTGPTPGQRHKSLTKRTVSSSKTKAFRKAKDRKEDLRFMKIVHDKKFGDRPKLKKHPQSTVTGYLASEQRKTNKAIGQKYNPYNPKSAKNPGGYEGSHVRGIDKRLSAGVGGVIKKIVTKIKPKPSGVFKPKPSGWSPKGSYTKADDKKINSMLKNLGDEIKAQPIPHKTQKLLKKLQKAYPSKSPHARNKESKKLFKTVQGKAAGGRISRGHGGSAAQQHYLQHGYGPVKTKLRSGKPKIAIKGW